MKQKQKKLKRKKLLIEQQMQPNIINPEKIP
jgi:hypothetical protein